MYLPDHELVELAEAISSKSSRPTIENLLVRSQLFTLQQLDDPDGEFAPILNKREFVTEVLRDLRDREKINKLLECLDIKLPPKFESFASLSAKERNDETRVPSSNKSITRSISKTTLWERLGRVKLDSKIAIAIIALAGTFFVILYGNNLCQQSAPPPWTRRALDVLCPETIEPTPEEGAVSTELPPEEEIVADQLSIPTITPSGTLLLQDTEANEEELP